MVARHFVNGGNMVIFYRIDDFLALTVSGNNAFLPQQFKLMGNGGLIHAKQVH